mmetsp:Transcript_83742/g.260197  ORF Transcript_83742/g.260197 Transcript_83742/m.260197 type:complete len:227 (+) Transcript_83742:1362-2042(+)
MEVPRREPLLRALLRAAIGGAVNAVPCAGDDVDEREQDQHDEKDVCHELHTLGADVLKDQLEDLLRLEEPQQPDSTKHAEHAQRGGVAAAPNARERDEHGLDPITAHQRKVEAEPRADVLPRHLGRPQLDKPQRRHVACQERHGEVERPEDADQPRERHGEGGLWRVQGLEGDHEDVIGHEGKPCELPGQVAEGAGQQDQGLQPGLEAALRGGGSFVVPVVGAARA